MGDALGEREALRLLLGRTKAVLLDFDGPVTDLFGDVSTAPVARRIKDMARGIWGPLDQDVEDCEDSHGILRHLREMYDRPAPTLRSRAALIEAEDIVTRQEFDAVKSAEPTPDVEGLVDALLKLDPRPRLVIVSNNSDGPVWEFLKAHGLQSRFDDVFGRDPDELKHMKPHPYAVDRAVRHLALKPSECLLIGDQLTDLDAAHAAGTRFLGYTRSAERAATMMEGEADWVVSSHEPVIAAAEELRKLN
jgi:phosphoglycolate phosphatase